MKRNFFKITALAAAVLLISASVSACASDTLPENGADTAGDTVPAAEESSAGDTIPEEKDYFTLTGAGAESFTVIRPDAVQAEENNENGAVRGAVEIKKRLGEITGSNFPIASDWEKGNPKSVVNDNYEILVGETNRAETEAARAELPDYGYLIRVDGRKIVILGTDDELTYLGCLAFLSEVVGTSAAAGDTVTVKKDIRIFEVRRRETLADFISSGKPYRVTLTEVIYARPLDIYKVGQGAASDGTYAYFILRTSGDGDAIISKYKLDTGEFVGHSQPFHVFHGNDMTYDSAKRLLVVAHGSSEGKILTTVNPDTLEVVEQTVNIPVGSGAITYSVEKDLYAISQGGKTLYIASSEFKVLKSFTRTPTGGYTAQGMGSDDKYIYFPMSGSADNILMTYNWSGQYVTDVHLPTAYESESMFWVNGTYYVNFYQSGGGAHLYRLDVYPQE
ncbi:MAG: hypothetical protein ILO42_04675 [Clostridia bacterium]|nr:hypothetical protein [Clostridia bacterium]